MDPFPNRTIYDRTYSLDAGVEVLCRMNDGLEPLQSQTLAQSMLNQQSDEYVKVEGSTWLEEKIDGQEGCICFVQKIGISLKQVVDIKRKGFVIPCNRLDFHLADEASYGILSWKMTFQYVKELYLHDIASSSISINLKSWPSLTLLDITTVDPFLTLSVKNTEHSNLSIVRVKYNVDNTSTGNFTCDGLKGLKVLSIRGLLLQSKTDCDFDKLEILSLDNTGINAVPPFVLEFKSLVSLSLRDNHLQEVPVDIFRLARLSHLDLSNNGNLSTLISSEEDTRSFQGATTGCRLRSLILSNTAISRVAAQVWRNLFSKEEFLNLSNLGISKLPKNIGLLTHLTEINLSMNCLENLGDDIKALVNLEKIDISSNRLPCIPTQLLALPKIRQIDAQCNTFQYAKYSLNSSLEFGPSSQDEGGDRRIPTADPQGLTSTSEESFDLSLLSPKFCESNARITVFDFESDQPYPQDYGHKESEKLISKIVAAYNKQNSPIGKALYMAEEYQKMDLQSRTEIENLESYILNRLDDIQSDDTHGIHIDSNDIKMAFDTGMTKLLSHPLVRRATMHLWRGGLDIRQETIQSYSLGSLFEYGIIYGLECFVATGWKFRRQLFNSPRGRFYLSFVMYIVFLLSLYMVTMSDIRYNSTPSHFVYQNLLEFTKSDEFSSLDDYWVFARNKLVPSIYDKAENEATGHFHRAYQDDSDYITLARLRFLKVLPQRCGELSFLPFEPISSQTECFPIFHPAYEQKKQHQFSNYTLNWASPDVLYGLELDGQSSSYHGGGYVLPFQSNVNSTLKLMDELYESGFIDRSLSAVVLDFVIENEKSGFLSFASILYESLPTHEIRSSSKIQIITQSSNLQTDELYYFFFNIMILLYGMGFFLHEFGQIVVMKIKYFTEMSNILDLVLIVLIDMHTFTWFKVYTSTFGFDSPSTSGGQLVSDAFLLAYWYRKRTLITTLLNLFANFRILQYFLIYEGIGVKIISTALMTKNFVKFLVLLVLAILIFCTPLIAIYGSQIEMFSDLYPSVINLFLSILGEFEIESQLRENRVGTALLAMFLLLSTVIILNYSVAFMSDIASQVDENSKEVYFAHFANEVWVYTNSFLPSPLNVFYLANSKMQGSIYGTFSYILRHIERMLRFRYTTFIDVFNQPRIDSMSDLKKGLLPGMYLGNIQSLRIDYSIVSFVGQFSFFCVDVIRNICKFIIPEISEAIWKHHLFLNPSLSGSNRRQDEEMIDNMFGHVQHGLFKFVWIMTLPISSTFYLLAEFEKIQKKIYSMAPLIVEKYITSRADTRPWMTNLLSVTFSRERMSYAEFKLVDGLSTRFRFKGDGRVVFEFIASEAESNEQVYQLEVVRGSVVGVGYCYEMGKLFVCLNGALAFERIQILNGDAQVEVMTDGFVVVEKEPSSWLYLQPTAPKRPKHLLTQQGDGECCVFDDYILNNNMSNTFVGPAFIVPENISSMKTGRPIWDSFLVSIFVQEASTHYFEVLTLEQGMPNFSEVGFDLQIVGDSTEESIFLSMKVESQESVSIKPEGRILSIKSPIISLNCSVNYTLQSVSFHVNRDPTPIHTIMIDGKKKMLQARPRLLIPELAKVLRYKMGTTPY